MAVALQRHQLSKLCSTSEVFERAQSILRLATARTSLGSGFVVKNPAALPAVCAYLASEQLNSNEVSLQSAVAAVCVTQQEFSETLKKVRAALGSEERNASMNVTYETLVSAYRVSPKEDVIACMEDTQGALPRFDMLRERYGSDVMTGAVFYWVCQLIEESSVQDRSLCQVYSFPPKAFKVAVSALDKQCESIADQIKKYIFRRRSAGQASTSDQPSHVPLPDPTPPQKSPMKSTIKVGRKMSTPTTTPSRKRSVAFSHVSSGGDGYDNNNGNKVPFPETPTKKRRIGDALSSAEPRRTRSSSPAKRSHSSVAATAAFRAALEGSPAKPPGMELHAEFPVAGTSTPRRLPSATASESVATTPVHSTDPRPLTVPTSSPTRSQGQITPTRPVPILRRFRPVFLEQQQWCAQDPKAERMWRAAEARWDEMVEVHGRPFQ